MTAEEIQRYVREEFAPAAQAEMEREQALFPLPKGAAWWQTDWAQGTCDSTCYVVEEELGSLEPFVGRWGGFRRDDGTVDGHYFLKDDATGVIVDPTSSQYGLEVCAIIPPGDPRHACYLQT